MGTRTRKTAWTIAAAALVVGPLAVGITATVVVLGAPRAAIAERVERVSARDGVGYRHGLHRGETLERLGEDREHGSR